MPLEHIRLWLRHVWTEEPEHWHFVLHLLPNKKGMHQATVQNIDDAVEHLQRWDSKGWDTFYACANFRTSDNRTQANISYIGMFWEDIDVYPKSAYVDARAAALAVIRVCRQLGLPIPTMVKSGSGLHIYWVLDLFISYARWKPIALGLKQALLDAGLELDTHRAADASSILRVPGTHHWKTGQSLEVMWDGKITLHPLDAFVRYGDIVPHKNPKFIRNLSDPKRDTLVSKSATYDAPTADAVANYCGQLAQFKVDAAEPEPLWKAHAGVMARMTNGYADFHAWSKRGFPNYNEDEAEAKLRNSHEHTTGPTTCAYYHSLRAKICEECSLWGKITTPLQAPHADVEDEPDAIDTPLVQVNGHVFEAPSPLTNMAASEVQLPDLRSLHMDWKDLDGSGIRSLVQKVDNSYKGKNRNDIVISRFPFYVAGVNSLEGSGEGENIFCNVLHLLPQGGWRPINISNKELFGPTGSQALANYGLVTSEWTLFRKALVRMHDQVKEKGKPSMQYARFGWKDDLTSFLIGDKLYTRERVLQVPIANHLMERGRKLGPVIGGSLDNWRREATKLLSDGLEAMALVLLSAAAAPIMRLLSSEGGDNLHLESQSGKGKSLALVCGASFYGEYDALRLIADDTRVSKFGLMGLLCHLPIFLDEPTTGDAALFAQLLKSFTEGKDKARGTSMGVIHETGHHWSTTLISASNKSVKDLLKHHGDTTDAMSTRVIEIRFDTEKVYTISEMEQIRNRMQANAGHAGALFIAHLVCNVEKIKNEIPNRQEKIIQTYGLDREHRYYIRYLTSLQIAMELINQLGILELSENRMMDWTVKQIKSQLTPQTVEEEPDNIYTGADKSRSVKILLEYLNEHQHCKLVVKDGKGGFNNIPILEPKGGNLYIRYELMQKTYYLHGIHFEKWLIKEDYGVERTINDLINQGVMESRRKAKNLGEGTIWDSGGRTDCWVAHINKLKNTLETEEGKIVQLERRKK